MFLRPFARFTLSARGNLSSTPTPPIPDVDKLKKALDEERAGRREATAALGKFEGMDPAKYQEMQSRFEAIKDKKIFDDEGVETLITARLAKFRSEHEARAAALAGDRDQWKDKATQAENKRRGDVLRRKLTEVAGEYVHKFAIADAVELGLKTFTLDDQDQLLAKNGDAMIYGKNGVDPLTTKEFYDARRDDRPHWFDKSTGAGARHSTNGLAPPDLTTLSPQARINALRAVGKT